MRVALAVIAGADAIDDGIERMLKSVAGKVDGVYIGCTFTEDGMHDTVDAISDLVDPQVFPFGTISPIGWNDDFSEARNASFALIERAIDRGDTTYDYIIWLDCDDVIPDGVDIRHACDLVKSKGAHGAFVEYQYQFDQERGMALVTHMKERLFRADVEWNWIYPIHENCTGPMGVRMMQLKPSEMTVRHLRGDADPKRERNNRMIAKWFRERGNEEPRAVMFMAHETVALTESAVNDTERSRLLGMALKLYQRFIATTPPNDDAYTCNRQVADILLQLGRFEDAINIDLQGVKMQPKVASSYIGIAMAYHAIEDWDRAAQWAQNALRLASDEASGFGANIQLEHEYKPLMILADCREKLGDLEAAFNAVVTASGIYNDEWTKQRVSELRKARTDARHRSLHKPISTNRELNYGRHPDKSICFFVPPSAEDWNPDKLKDDGLGGTESSVIKLAHELARLGWRVAIFGQPGPVWEDKISYNEQESGGQVEWYRSGQWHPDEEFTVFVGLRVPEIFDSPIKAKLKILWLHDISMGPTRYGDYGDRFSRADVIVTPSPFHIKHLARVYNAELHPWAADNEVICNGFDFNLFDYEQNEEHVRRDPNRVIYASSPDRGLPRLLELWPEIQRRNSKATLNIYYGWESIDAIIAHGGVSAPQLAYFKQKTQAKIAQLIIEDGCNIYEYGRISETRLARHMKRSGIIAYPANFMETFGIVFAQAMAAGVIPVVPALGFLPQLVGPCGLVVPGAPDSMEYGPRFIDAMMKAFNPPPSMSIREGLRRNVHLLDWSQMGEAWSAMIERQIKSRTANPIEVLNA